MSDTANQSNELGAFLAGFVIGGLVGAAVALILAPRSGEEIRSQLVARGEEFRDRAREYGDEYLTPSRNRLQDVGGEVRNRVRIVLEEGKPASTPNDEPPLEGETAPPELEEDDEEAT